MSLFIRAGPAPAPSEDGYSIVQPGLEAPGKDGDSLVTHPMAASPPGKELFGGSHLNAMNSSHCPTLHHGREFVPIIPRLDGD